MDVICQNIEGLCQILNIFPDKFGHFFEGILTRTLILSLFPILTLDVTFDDFLGGQSFPVLDGEHFLHQFLSLTDYLS